MPYSVGGYIPVPSEGNGLAYPRPQNFTAVKKCDAKFLKAKVLTLKERDALLGIKKLDVASSEPRKRLK